MELKELEDRRDSLALRVRELEALKRNLTEETCTARLELAKLREDSAKELLSAKEKAKKLTNQANAKDSKIETSLREAEEKNLLADERLKEIANQERIICQRQEELKLRDIDFIGRVQQEEHIFIENEAKSVEIGKKISALSLLEEQNSKVLAETSKQLEAIKKESSGLLAAQKKLAHDGEKLKKKAEELEDKQKIADYKEQYFAKIESEHNRRTNELDRRELELKSQAEKLEKRIAEIELKKREANALEKKVESLIKIHELEDEVKQYGGGSRRAV